MFVSVIRATILTSSTFREVPFARVNEDASALVFTSPDMGKEVEVISEDILTVQARKSAFVVHPLKAVTVAAGALATATAVQFDMPVVGSESVKVSVDGVDE